MCGIIFFVHFLKEKKYIPHIHINSNIFVIVKESMGGSIWLEQPAGALAHSFCSLKLSFLLWNAVEMLSKFSPSFELFITELAHVHAPCTCWYTSLGLSLVNLCFVGLIFRAPDWEPKRVEGKRLFFLFYIRKGLPQLGTYLGNASPLLSHPEQRWKPGLGP